MASGSAVGVQNVACVNPTALSMTIVNGTYTTAFKDVNVVYSRTGNMVLVSGSFTLNGAASSSALYSGIRLPYKTAAGWVPGNARCSQNGKILKLETGQATGNLFYVYFQASDGTYLPSGYTVGFSLVYPAGE